MQNLEVFNKVRSDLTLLVEKNKGLTISGVNDIVGYQKMKEAKSEVRKGEIELEKLAKKEREGALNWQREIIRLEKEIKEQITFNIINEYTKQLDEYEMLKSREERLALLPSRKKSLEEIFVNLSDEEILDLDDKKFSELYSKLKLEYLDKKERERINKEREIENEKIKKENERIKKENEILLKQQKEKDDLIAKQNKEREDLRIKLEKENKEKEDKIKADNESKRQLELGPDKNKLLKFANDVLLIDIPEVKDDKAKLIVENAKELLNKTSTYITNNSINL